MFLMQQEKFFNSVKNRITDPSYNRHNSKSYNCNSPEAYRRAVEHALDDFLKKLDKRGSDLSSDEAQDFADQIRSADPSSLIGQYNSGVQSEMEAQIAEAAGPEAAEAAALAEDVATLVEGAEAAGALVESAAPVAAEIAEIIL